VKTPDEKPAAEGIGDGPSKESRPLAGPPPAETLNKPLSLGLRLLLGGLAMAILIGVLVIVLWVLEEAR